MRPIKTGFSPGTKVNVYQYAPESGQFSLIAAEVSAAREGLVTYRNRTMAAYLITTQKIAGAVVADEASLQHFPRRIPAWSWLAGAAVLLLGSGAVVWLLLIRKNRAPAASGKP